MHFTLKVVAGTANLDLAMEVCRFLNADLSTAIVERFKDGEIKVQVEDSVRGCDCFVFQPTCRPVNDNIMELCLIIDALRRASAARITAVVPYYSYARQDRKTKPRVPIAAAMLARFLEASGVDHVITLELHAGQIQGFFKVPVDNISTRSVMVNSIKKLFLNHMNNLVIVTPDAAGGERSERFRSYLKSEEDIEAEFAVMNKWKTKLEEFSTKKSAGTQIRIAPNKKEFKMELMGNVQGKVCIIVDDIADTGSSLLAAAKCLRKNGAIKVIACVSHCLLNEDGLRSVVHDRNLDHLIITDTVPVLTVSELPPTLNTRKLHERAPSSPAFGGVDMDVDIQEAKSVCPKVIHVSVAHLIAESIRRVHNEESISSGLL
ncbi:ribose-phosphate pyrophosphokinase [Acrasis kona]|uniref:ribose-phosphate diphosphokinase n=1 Tax=Acrasis kona TaxID=1008807 RepID=A0AAW2ZFG6_9EUKA